MSIYVTSIFFNQYLGQSDVFRNTACYLDGKDCAHVLLGPEEAMFGTQIPLLRSLNFEQRSQVMIQRPRSRGVFVILGRFSSIIQYCNLHNDEPVY
jgi:hypothetical protein